MDTYQHITEIWSHQNGGYGVSQGNFEILLQKDKTLKSTPFIIKKWLK